MLTRHSIVMVTHRARRGTGPNIVSVLPKSGQLAAMTHSLTLQIKPPQLLTRPAGYIS